MQKCGQFLVILLALFVGCQSLTRSVVKHMTNLDPRAAKEGIENLLTLAKNRSNVVPHVSNQCTWALGNITNSTSLEKYIDATGKLPSGIEDGNLLSLGSYGLCETIPTSHYCMVNFNAKLFGRWVPVKWGLCITNKCNEYDIAYGLNDIVRGVFHIQSFYVSTQTDPRSVYCAKPTEYTASAICCIAVCAILGILCLLGTLVDLYENPSLATPLENDDQQNNQVQNGTLPHDDREHLLQSEQLNTQNPESNNVQFKAKQKSMLVKILLCFSIVKNTKKIMATDVPPGAITSINGMRVLSITWVILGHTYLFMLMSGVVDNLVPSSGIVHRFTFQAVDNAFLSVDSFFFLSGLLVGYLGLRRMFKNDGRFPCFQFYFHRFWRLTPTYMFVIWFYAALDPHLSKGPLWYTHQQTNPCSKYWWTNLLYINNFYPKYLSKECLGWSWYLANDMQFYAISPILLFLMYRFKKVGLLVGIGGMIQASIIVTAVIIGVYNLPISFAGELGGAADKAGGMYTNYVYIKPYCRITPYLVGMALGYVFFVDKKHSFIRKISPNKRLLVVLVGWLVAIGTGIATVYGMYGQYKENGRLFSKAENIIYGSLFRFAWAVALAWVVYACQTGFGGLVNSILSARFWIPLSRLTYGTYLVHIIVIGVFFGGLQHEIAYTDTLLVFYFVSLVAVSYGIAFILAVVVEFPLMQLEELFLKRH